MKRHQQEKCWSCGNPIRKLRIVAQRGFWNGIFCSNTCLGAYSKKHIEPNSKERLKIHTSKIP